MELGQAREGPGASDDRTHVVVRLRSCPALHGEEPIAERRRGQLCGATETGVQRLALCAGRRSDLTCRDGTGLKEEWRDAQREWRAGADVAVGLACAPNGGCAAIGCLVELRRLFGMGGLEATPHDSPRLVRREQGHRDRHAEARNLHANDLTH